MFVSLHLLWADLELMRLIDTAFIGFQISTYAHAIMLGEATIFSIGIPIDTATIA